MAAMTAPISSSLCAAAMLMAAVVCAWPQQADKGQTAYMDNCAGCHGADAKGAGPLSAKLKTKPTDLTLLAKRNHGSFDTAAVYQMIDGRDKRPSHRVAEMPIWGCRHKNPVVSLPQASSKKHRKFQKESFRRCKGARPNSTRFSICLAAQRRPCKSAFARSSIISANCRRSEKVNGRPLKRVNFAVLIRVRKAMPQ
jgi:Cytochrome c